MSVFANGMGVSGKATGNKTIAAMPDVCLSPPPPPAGPIPIPYPNFGMASDTSDGCTSVIVMGKEAGKKNASKYSKITGDEAATNSFGAGVVSHKISGALKFEAYSFDVMFEGGGAERFADLTSTNHSNPTNGGVSVSIDKPNVAMDPNVDPCPDLRKANDTVFKTAEAASNDPSGLKPGQRAELKKLPVSGTVSHARFLPDSGAGSVVAGTSNKMLRTKSNGYFGEAVTSTEAQRKANAVPQKICENQPDHNHSDGGFWGHSEPCIFNKLAGGPPPPPPLGIPGGTLIMAIDWRCKTAGGTVPKDGACGHCAKVMKAACACIKIFLCNMDGSQEEVCKKSEPEPGK